MRAAQFTHVAFPALSGLTADAQRDRWQPIEVFLLRAIAFELACNVTHYLAQHGGQLANLPY
jgi:hypothetical protein